MTRSAPGKTVAALALAGALALPAAARAGDGDGGTPPGLLTVNGGASVVTATSADGLTLTAPAVALTRHRYRFAGAVPARYAGWRVAVQVAQGNGRWRRVARAVAKADGSFSARWSPRTPGRRRYRAVLDTGRSARAAGGAPEVRLTIYRQATATWYGPGFYGRRTACGQRLTGDTLGVASRTLPCGTPVALLYRGRSITVPVIDRGPFGRWASYDLTSATASLLGMTETSRIGALPLR